MTGSVQEKNNMFYTVINFKPINGKRKQKWETTELEAVKGNKRKAQKILRERIRNYELEENLKRTDIMFHTYIVTWLENIARLKVEESTYSAYCASIHKHIIPYFEPLNLRLSDVKRADIQNYVTYKFENGKLKSEGGLASQTIRHHVAIMKQVFGEALKDNMILINPCDNVTLPKPKKYEAAFYNAEQIKYLFNAIKNDWIYPLVFVTVVLGLRRSEVLGIKWDCIDFNNKTLTIRHTVVPTNDSSKIIRKDSTKTSASYRTYPLSDELIELFKYVKEEEAYNKKLLKEQYQVNDYVFKDALGKPHTPSYISQHFVNLLNKHGLPKIRFHDLRHSCASLLLAQDFSLKDIQVWLGHSDIQTTANIYSHLDIKRKTRMVESLSGTFDDKC